MDITASKKDDKDEPDSIPSFGRIDIEKIEFGGQEEKASENLPSPAEINIKNKLSDFYYIERDNINISIQGG
jgi:stage III sporulation protein AF